MKKYLALFLTLVLVGTMSSLWVTAEEDTTPITDGFEFDITGVNVKVVPESGIICTTQTAYNESSQNWSILILCEKVADNLYRAKQDAVTATGSTPAMTLEANDIVIGIHSASSNPDLIDQYANVLQKLQAIKVKAGMYFTLTDVDLTATGTVAGKAKVSVNNPQDPAPTQETITIDGVFNDTGWRADGWTHVDSTNARVMNPITEEAPRLENFDFQFRADDTTLYVALKSNTKPFGTDTIYGNGKGTQFRLWIFNDGHKDDAGNEFTTYNYFIDFIYKNGELALLTKQNTLYNGNSSVEVTIDGLNAKATGTNADNYWYVEAAMPFASIGATTGTHVYVTFSGPTEIDTSATGNQPTNNSWTYGNLGTFDDNGTSTISWTYKRWDKDNDVDLTFADIKLGAIGDDDDYEIIVGNPIDNPQYELVISTNPTTYKPGDTITVTVTVKNVVPTAGLGLIQFRLYYDARKVEPVVKNDGSTNAAMDDFLKVCPDITSWKDGALNQLVEADGYYDISFMTDQNTGLVKEDGSFVVEIPFKVKNDAAKKIIFQIPHGADGTMAADIDTNEVYGNGGYVLVSPASATSSSSSKPSTSSTTTSAPGTGDAGTYAIAIIAMIALAGAATVAVKKRSR